MITPTTRIIMVDVETTNDLESPLVYDIGYQIFSLAEGVLCEKSFVNADIFLDKGMMANAFFAEKIPAYWTDIKAKRRTLKKWFNIKREFAADCRKYGVKIVCAHNASFDNRALNTTQRYQTTSKYRYFLPFGLEWWDTLKMARAVLKSDDSYGEFCYINDYLTQRGCRRYTAEIIYRWLSGDNAFIEDHTGLEDVRIERQIFEYLVRENPEINGKLWGD